MKKLIAMKYAILSFLFVAALALSSSSAFAGGGQVQHQWLGSIGLGEIIRHLLGQ